MKKRSSGISVRRVIQISCLLLFLILIVFASFPVPPLPSDAFLRMDPLVFLGVTIADRNGLPALWPAPAFLILTVLLGRCFCGYVCPMGTTIDMADALISHPPAKNRRAPARSWRSLKYFILFFLFGAAVFEISFIFLASPLSLITRFFATLVHPMLSLPADMGVGFLGPLADRLNLTALAYAQIFQPRFALQWVTASIFIGVFALTLAAPRFWCRYLCPAGALFGFCSARPLIRRRVSEECVQCGQCASACPMNAIGENPSQTDHRECLACGTCVRICPVNAITFAASFGTCGPEEQTVPFLPERRRFIGAGLSGAGAALISATGLHYRSDAAVPGQVLLPEVIRPPGALPEKSFLNRCIRCGLCMKTCPTNALQPIGLDMGLYGFYSPVIRPRRGPCDPECSACGQVCPTAAIRPLPPEEKRWAKVGTAHILKHKCLAWEFDRKCLVCDEVCPYDAIELRSVDGIQVPVPFVRENRCAGCGFCEHHCPVQARAAIIVAPMEALRIEDGSFQERGREIGLELNLLKRGGGKRGEEEATGDSGPPPGFTE